MGYSRSYCTRIRLSRLRKFLFALFGEPLCLALGAQRAEGLLASFAGLHQQWPSESNGFSMCLHSQNAIVPRHELGWVFL